MNELSLFTGAGGGVLGGLLIGWKSVGYVEYDEYCQKVLAQRIKDGHLHKAPIFGNIRTFISEGYAASYTGLVDVISAGFPCQPFSVAGKRAGADDSRNMWPATIECIRIVRPRYAFLENVPGLLSSGYFGTILSDLSESGYDARWRVLSAAECGAPHKRDRLWIVADAKGHNRRDKSNNLTNGKGRNSRSKFMQGSSYAGQIANADSRRRQQRDADERPVSELDQAGAKVPGADGTGLQAAWPKQQAARASELRSEIPNATITRLEGQESAREQRREPGLSAECNWWEVEPELGRVADGVAHRVDRLRAIGNGQVSAVAAAAWRLLTE